MQHPQQFSVLDKFGQDFRNNNNNNNNKVILKNASAILARIQKPLLKMNVIGKVRKRQKSLR